MALPVELDFTKNPAATPARMDAAMEYIMAYFRSLDPIKTAVDDSVDELRRVGLERLTEVLTPIFNDASALADALAAIEAEWIGNDLPGQMIAAVIEALRDGVPTEFDTLDKMADKIIDYRSNYLGAKSAAPTLDDNGDPVAIGAMYFDTTLDQMRVLGVTGWKDAGSAVTGLLARQSFTAVGGETSVTVPGSYDPGNIIVSVNGLVLSPSDVVVTSGTTIDLPAALTAGDEVSWTKFTALTIANVYTKAEGDGRYLAKAGGAMSGRVDVKTATLAVDPATTGTALNVANYNVFRRTVTGATAFTFSNVPEGFVEVIVYLTNGGLSATDPWPANVRWPGGVKPTRTASGLDIYGFITIDQGVTWDGVMIKNSKLP